MILTESLALNDTSERLILVTPAAQFASAHDIMVSRDRVQNIESQDILRSHYIGFADTANLLAPTNSNKLAFAMVAQPNIRSVIYAYLDTVPEQSSGAIKLTDLPKDTGTIRARPATNIGNSSPNVMLFYAVSNIGNSMTDPGVKGAGRRLIGGLYAYINHLPVVPSTVSPTGEFPQWLRDKNLSYTISDHELVRLHLTRIARSEDSVGNFHLGNGAFVGDCSVVACDPNHPEAINHRRVMTNYVYASPEAVTAFKKSYKAPNSVIPMATHLANRLPDGLNANVFSLAGEIFPHAVDKGIKIDYTALTRLYEPQTSRRADTTPSTSEESHPSPSA